MKDLKLSLSGKGNMIWQLVILFNWPNLIPNKFSQILVVTEGGNGKSEFENSGPR